MSISESGRSSSPIASFMIRNLPFFQGMVVLFFVLTAAIVFGCIPVYFDAISDKCLREPCLIGPSPPYSVTELALHNLTPQSYATSFVIIDCTLILAYYAAALIILIKCFREPLGLLAAIMLVSFGTNFPTLPIAAAEGNLLLEAWLEIENAVGLSTFFLFFFLFPDGRFIRRKPVILVYLLCLLYVAFHVVPTGVDYHEWPFALQILLLLIPTTLLMVTQIYRYRHISTPEEKQQTKWVVFGMTIALTGLIGISSVYVPPFSHGPLWFIAINAVLHLFMIMIPLTLSMAILRHRLWDIDPIVNRTLVYVALSGAVIAVYTLTVLYLGRLFHSEDHFLVSLVATALVAVMFSPLKEWLQRHVNRMLKGRHDDPYAVLSELGDQLIKPIEPDDMLYVVVQSIRDALRLPYASISIDINGHDKLATMSGQQPEDTVSFPIIHQGETLGTLYVSPRSPGEPFTAEDVKLLSILLQQAGPIVQNVHMTFGMRLLADDLQESREKMVLAREEERRQIRHNLHDDLAPRLAALALNAAAAEKYVRQDPDLAVGILADFRQVIRSTVDEIRTLVHDLRPPTLDEFGLVGAVRERIRELTKVMLASSEERLPRIELVAPDQLPPLPAAVEVAAFRIITESLVNVVRHANATHCLVHLELLTPAMLSITVTDNGKGIQTVPVSSENGGIGLVSIRERAAELGGQCSIERLEGSGTRISALLPLPSLPTISAHQ
ncbi:GAF domain-containing sensor histidine kinase [Brevibacillus migulae]|uniref:GAF domain-containing sensor histidine kinase n=1 Tax=Brevibacillus migulae TaxID=1644114 RepID=UPI00142F7122|nr:histidine kinase [Brevibacillus migulae]